MITLCSEPTHWSAGNMLPLQLGSNSKRSKKVAEAGSKLTEPCVENLDRHNVFQAKGTVRQPLQEWPLSAIGLLCCLIYWFLLRVLIILQDGDHICLWNTELSLIYSVTAQRTIVFSIMNASIRENSGSTEFIALVLLCSFSYIVQPIRFWTGLNITLLH